MRDVYIVGIGITSFGRLEYPLVEIACYPAVVALQDAGLSKVDQLFVANMGGGRVNGQTALGTAVVDHLSLTPAMAESVENGPASGSSAVKLGYQAIASGMAETVLVVGAERMNEANALDVTEFVATMAHPMAEQIYGVTLPALAGMFTRLYMEKYGLTRRHLAMVTEKNHANAMDNFFAHVHTRVTVEGILDDQDALTNNPVIADPLHFFDMCPVSDGGCALVLASGEVARKLGKPLVKIAGIGQATDTHAVHERPDPTELTAVRIAAEKAYKMAGVGPKDINVAELHDAFTILEIVESEEVGFFKKGEGHLALERGETKIGGRIPINPSGGLKAKGHPVGATGVGQIHEIVLQLRGGAEKRQVEGAKVGLACNFGGFGNNVIVTILKRES